jgi:hypothetical protein
MQSFTTDDDLFHSRSSSKIRPALTSFADEVCATVARLFAYVGVLALFGILGVHAWNQLQFERAEEPSLETAWSIAGRASPDFALSRQDGSDKSDDSKAYLVLRHPAGGRKDVLRWSGARAQPLAELEIYRPGAEYGSATTARADLARRMPAPDSRHGVAELESAGTIESKFGSVALLRQAGTGTGAASCLGFLKRIDAPALQISGWSCQGDSLSTRRADIDCMLSRLVSARDRNEPKLAQLFARAELPPGSCPSVTVSADWMTGASAPSLRGSL